MRFQAVLRKIQIKLKSIHLTCTLIKNVETPSKTLIYWAFFPFPVWVAEDLIHGTTPSWIPFYLDRGFLFEKIWQWNVWLNWQGNYPLTYRTEGERDPYNTAQSLDSPRKMPWQQHSFIGPGISTAAPWPCMELPGSFNDFLLRVWQRLIAIHCCQDYNL